MTETTTQRTNRLLAMSRAELVLHAQDLTLRVEELEGALEIAKKGLRHYENRNAAHGTRNPAAIALDDIAATLKGPQ